MKARSKGGTVNFEEMSPELQEKAKACKGADELVALAKEEGYELSDEELEYISGGGWHCDDYGPTK